MAYQLWVVLANTANNTSVPVAFYLKSNRTARAYTKILVHFKEEMGVTGPGKVLMDFETATANAFTQVVPETEINYCEVHLKR